MREFYLTYNNVIDICNSNDGNLDRLYLLSDRNYIFAFDYDSRLDKIVAIQIVGIFNDDIRKYDEFDCMDIFGEELSEMKFRFFDPKGQVVIHDFMWSYDE